MPFFSHLQHLPFGFRPPAHSLCRILGTQTGRQVRPQCARLSPATQLDNIAIKHDRHYVSGPIGNSIPSRPPPNPPTPLTPTLCLTNIGKPWKSKFADDMQNEIIDYGGTYTTNPILSMRKRQICRLLNLVCDVPSSVPVNALDLTFSVDSHLDLVRAKGG